MSNVLGEIKSVLIPKEEYERLKSLCARAAEALEQLHLVNVNREPECVYCQVIAELREASK